MDAKTAKNYIDFVNESIEKLDKETANFQNIMSKFNNVSVDTDEIVQKAHEMAKISIETGSIDNLNKFVNKVILTENDNRRSDTTKKQ